MEGRALKSDARLTWSWLIPWFSGGVAAIVVDLLGAPRVTNFLVGIAAGVSWQLLYRRDLTSRLTFAAVFATLSIVGVLVTRTAFEWNDMNTTGLLMLGILLGMIYAEHFQRWRDRTGWRRPARADERAHR